MSGGDSKTGQLSRAQSSLIAKLAVLGILAVVILIAANAMNSITGSPLSSVPTSQGSSSPPALRSSSDNPAASELKQVEREMEQRLEEVFGQINGVGKVDVTLTLASGPEKVFASNTTVGRKNIEEKDQGGGTRVTTEITENGQMVIAHQGSAESDLPVTVKEIPPVIKGVLVVAEGAGNPQIREELSRAAQTVLNISAYKVTVLPMKGR